MKVPKIRRLASPQTQAPSRAAAYQEFPPAVAQARWVSPLTTWLTSLLGPPEEADSVPASTEEGLPATELTLSPEEAEKRKAYDAVKKTPHQMQHLGDDLGQMVRLMLEKAGYDKPQDWFDEMVTIQFLGKSARRIRPEFATQLKVAEKSLCDQLAKEDPALADPVAAGQYLGIDQAYATFRALKPEKPEYQSMHLFGLAIDINVYDNPWVGQTKTNRQDLRGVLDRMGALLATPLTSDYQAAYTGPDKKIESQARLGEIFDTYQNMDDQFVQYFALLDDDEALQQWLDLSPPKPWKGKSVAQAQKMIAKDLALMSKSWSRKGKKGRDNLKREGIMDLDKRLVMAMGEAELEWGGKFGDMMHFDMRFTGIGEKIQATKGKKEVRDLKKAIEAARTAQKAAAEAAKAAGT